jgi:hypothetical protein
MAKPIWVREHSCSSCGFETDRDANAAMNTIQRGFFELRLGWHEDTSVETVTATDTAEVQRVQVTSWNGGASGFDSEAIHVARVATEDVELGEKSLSNGTPTLVIEIRAHTPAFL